MQNNRFSHTLKLAVFILFVFMFIGLMYYTTQRLVDFDPNATLLDNSLQDSFYLEIKTQLENKYGSVSGRAFHFSEEDCFCQIVASAHVSDVKAMIENVSMENITIQLSDHPEMRQLLPSTPAIIMYNTQGEMMYIGPYSTGYLCTAGNGLVEELIPHMDEKRDDPLVMSLARGCYCNLTD